MNRGLQSELMTLKQSTLIIQGEDDKTEQEFGVDARPPVQVFNAGMCMNRGLQSELMTLKQSTLIIQGEDDKRQRQEYSQNMKHCQLVTLPGQNVVSWEYPKAMANHLEDWI